MQTDPHTHDDWTPCPPGALTGLSSELRSLRRQRTMLQASAFAAMVLLVGAAGWWVARGSTAPSTEPAITEIACRDCHKLLPDYIAGRTAPAVTAQIRHHLNRCPRCVDALHELEHAGPPQAFLRRSRHCPECEAAVAARTLTDRPSSLAALFDR